MTPSRVVHRASCGVASQGKVFGIRRIAAARALRSGVRGCQRCKPDPGPAVQPGSRVRLLERIPGPTGPDPGSPDPGSVGLVRDLRWEGGRWRIDVRWPCGRTLALLSPHDDEYYEVVDEEGPVLYVESYADDGTPVTRFNRVDAIETVEAVRILRLRAQSLHDPSGEAALQVVATDSDHGDTHILNLTWEAAEDLLDRLRRAL